MRGTALRQDFLATALKWVSNDDVGNYMSRHRHDDNINELKTILILSLNGYQEYLPVSKKKCRG